MLWFSGAVIFMVIKFFEWSAKYDHGIFPGTEHLHAMEHGEGLFFNLYFMMTGLHGIHVVIGMIVMLVVLVVRPYGIFGTEEMNSVMTTGAPWYTSGTHMWNGTAPNLKARPTTIKHSAKTRMILRSPCPASTSETSAISRLPVAP